MTFLQNYINKKRIKEFQLLERRRVSQNIPCKQFSVSGSFTRKLNQSFRNHNHNATLICPEHKNVG